MPDFTKYSNEIAGEHGNYHWPVRFDKNTRGFVGVVQWDKPLEATGIREVKARVLLSPRQVDALLNFLHADDDRADL